MVRSSTIRLNYTFRMTKNSTSFEPSDKLALQYIKEKGYASYSSLKNVRDCVDPTKKTSAVWFDVGTEVHSRFLEKKKPILKLSKEDTASVVSMVEALELPDAVRALLLSGHADADALTAKLPAQWHSMEHNAANWVISGLTTPDEAHDCLGLRLWTRLAQEAHVVAPVAAAFGQQEHAGADGMEPGVLVITSDAAHASQCRISTPKRRIRSKIVGGISRGTTTTTL